MSIINMHYTLPYAPYTHIQELFQAIETGVTSLSLNHIRFENNSGTELAQAFQAIPTNITSLDLSKNYFHRKTTAELTKAFQAIPASITSFHLANNRFTEEQIKTLFTVLRTRKDVYLDFGEVQISQELKEKIHETNMGRSLLGQLLSHSIFPQSETASEPAQAATSFAQSSSCTIS